MPDQAKADAGQPPRKREWDGTHHSWSYRPQAFRWAGQYVAGINLVPLATDMRAWMQQRGHLSLMSPSSRFSNPYSISGTTLAFLMGRVINASHDYVTKEVPGHDELDVEVERLRLYNEIILYSARFCEAAIKQLLYCTQIPESRYRRMALGQLLESPCPSCKKASGKKPHHVSLVGTLAHPFGLCLDFEHCAMDHMDLVNRMRNSQAAHSASQELIIRTVDQSKAQLAQDSREVLSGFGHMLSHLEDLEQQMLDDLTEKGRAINRLKRRGLSAEDSNFNLVPGEEFVFDLPSRGEGQS